MATKLLLPLLVTTTILLFPSVTHSLTSSEESRLVLQNDDGVIDERLRELPGGILIPPEPQLLPVPTMDPQLPKLPPSRSPSPSSSSDKVSRRSSYGQSSHVRSIVQSMRDRMKTSQSSSMKTSFARARSSPLLTTTPPNTLEMALKRIEILASRAGFNMSSIPRRSQLQIVTRLTSKLPSNMATAVKTALKTNDVKVYEYLPEPARDPLLEDDPEFLGHFLPHEEVDDFTDSVAENRPKIDASSISITNDNYKPAQVYSETDLSYFKVPHEQIPQLSSPTFDFLRSSSPLTPPEELPLESNHRAIVAYSTTPKTTKPAPVLLQDKLKWAPPKRVVLTTTTTVPTTTTTTTTTTEAPSTTTPAAPEEEEEQQQQQVRSGKEVKQSSSLRPIKVSIVTEEDQQQQQQQSENSNNHNNHNNQHSSGDDNDSSSSSSSNLKYVEVQQLHNSRNSSNSNLLFQVESSGAVETPSDDLTEDEIAAMVEELQKYDNEDNLESSAAASDKKKSILEFQYQRLLEPHPLEYPDHPDHIKATTTTAASPTTNNKRPHPGPPHQHRPPPPSHMRRPPPPMRPPPPPPGSPRRPPPPPPPMRINSVQVSEIPSNFDKDCDYFSNEICLLAKDYPVEQISSQLESNPSLALSLLPREDQRDSSDSSSADKPSSAKLSSEGGFLCPSKVAYGKIKKAKSSTTGKWKWIVNYGDNTQTLRIEKCLTPGDKCSYMQLQYRTACTQVYNYHRLVSWDNNNGIHIDTYKIPTCCTCHVQGYYIPSQQQSPAITRQPPPHAQRRRIMMGGGGGPHPHGPHHNHHHNQFNSRRLPPTPPTTSAAAAKEAEDDGDLEDLLKQYALLRDKIAKTKGTDAPSDLSTHLDFLLKKRKRSSSSSSSNSNRSSNRSPSVDYKKLLQRLHVERNLRGKALMSSAKNYIRKKNNKKSSPSNNTKKRQSRNMKQVDKSKRLHLLTLLKKLKEKKIKSHIKAKLVAQQQKQINSQRTSRSYRNHPMKNTQRTLLRRQY